MIGQLRAPVAVANAIATAVAQVDEGDVEVVNIRETDGRLGPLVFVLVALGVVTLIATAMYWWATRPSHTIEVETTKGDDDG